MEVRSEAEGERVRSEADEDAARSDSRAADDRRVDLAPQQSSIGHETLSTESKRQGLASCSTSAVLAGRHVICCPPSQISSSGSSCAQPALSLRSSGAGPPRPVWFGSPLPGRQPQAFCFSALS
jgi:hypothetical protein